MKLKTNKGFTLIELLVVIAIIGILFSAGVVSYRRSVQLSRDGRRKADLELLRQAFETYRSEHGDYPTCQSGNGCWVNETNFDILTPDYIATIPQDPNQGDRTYRYYRYTDTTYDLCAGLETETDAINGACNDANCASGIICSYRITNP